MRFRSELCGWPQPPHNPDDSKSNVTCASPPVPCHPWTKSPHSGLGGRIGLHESERPHEPNFARPKARMVLQPSEPQSVTQTTSFLACPLGGLHGTFLPSKLVISPVLEIAISMSRHEARPTRITPLLVMAASKRCFAARQKSVNPSPSHRAARNVVAPVTSSRRARCSNNQFT